MAARWLEIGLRMPGIMNGEVRFHLLIMATYIDAISVPVTYIEIALADLGQAKREVILQAC